MTNEREIVYDGKFIKVYETEKGFFYSERRGKDSIAVFLIKRLGNEIEVLVRYQPLVVVPSTPLALYPCPITGSLEDKQTELQCVINEVQEEAGFVIEEKDVRKLGTYFVGTQTSEVVYMYYIDVTNKEQNFKSSGDGTFHESISMNKWENLENLRNYNYSACKIGYYILREILSKKTVYDLITEITSKSDKDVMGRPLYKTRYEGPSFVIEVDRHWCDGRESTPENKNMKLKNKIVALCVFCNEKLNSNINYTRKCTTFYADEKDCICDKCAKKIRIFKSWTM